MNRTCVRKTFGSGLTRTYVCAIVYLQGNNKKEKAHSRVAAHNVNGTFSSKYNYIAEATHYLLLHNSNY